DVPRHHETVRTRALCFVSENPHRLAISNGVAVHEWDETKDTIDIETSLCPNCDNHSINIFGVGYDVKDLTVNVVPRSQSMQFPEYVPKSIRNDYEEAYLIVNLSPKASATLSRRCLQGMIRDYWQISDERSLYHEIDAIKDKVDPQVWSVLDSVRQIGNIGAHMEKDINLIVDIDAGEAERLIK